MILDVGLICFGLMIGLLVNAVLILAIMAFLLKVKVEVKPRGISALKVAPQKRVKKYQFCIDMHWIEGYICVPKFKFKTLDMAGLVLELRDFLFSLDDVAGYHHWSIREPFRTFFGFEWEGEWYEWYVLPFGVASVP